MSLSTLSKGLPSFVAKKVDGQKPSVFNVFRGSGESDSGLEKWQIALLVGSPIVIGAAFYYFYFRNIEDENKSDSSNGPKRVNNDKRKSDEAKIPGDPYDLAIYYKNQGNNLFGRGNYDAALEAYSKAIECCPVDKYETIAIFHQNRAAAYEMVKNFEKVIEECTLALQHNKTYVKALQRRAKGTTKMATLNYIINYFIYLFSL